jgi:AcrR family transcriptional regulator
MTIDMPRLKAAERREQLLAVATKLFAKWGATATTTAAIADAAGVTEPILYRHFRSKQDLFVAITRRMSEETVTTWKRLIDNIPDPDQKIRTIAREFPQHSARLADAYHVIHGALATSRDRKILSVIREHYTQMHAFFYNVIKEGQALGQFRSDMDPSLPAWEIIYMGIGCTMISLNLSDMSAFTIADAIECILSSLRPPDAKK